MRRRVWFPTLILVIFVVLVVNGSLELSRAAMVFPWALGALGAVLLLWEIVKEVRGTRKGASAGAQDAGSTQLLTHLPRIGWLLAILPMLYLLGFLVTIPLHTLLTLKFNGEKWLLSIVISAVVGAFFYFVFALGVRVPFYESLLFLYIAD